MTLGSWYSGGIDGFAYAAKELGIQTAYHVENNIKLHPYLKKIYGQDIKIFNHDTHFQCFPRTKIIAGGDPCQPSSNSGLRKGESDHRYRWPIMFKGIRKLRPDWVINENVIGSISNMVLDKKISDLEAIGYTCQPFIIPALAVDTYHRRDRVFLIAHADVQGWGVALCSNQKIFNSPGWQTTSLGSSGNAFLQFEERFHEPAIFSVPHEVPDSITQLGIVGNSIVHQILTVILEAIIAIENQQE